MGEGGGEQRPVTPNTKQTKAKIMKPTSPVTNTNIYIKYPLPKINKYTKVSSLSAMREEEDVKKTRRKAYGLHPHFNMRHGRQVTFNTG